MIKLLMVREIPHNSQKCLHFKAYSSIFRWCFFLFVSEAAEVARPISFYLLVQKCKYWDVLHGQRGRCSSYIHSAAV